MENPIETFKTLQTTKEFLQYISEFDGIPDSVRGTAKSLFDEFPGDFQCDRMIADYVISVEERVRKGWDPCPIDYSPKRGGWIFWDETWAYHHGPYKSRDEAQIALTEYAKTL